MDAIEDETPFYEVHSFPKEAFLFLFSSIFINKYRKVHRYEIQTNVFNILYFSILCTL